MTKYEYFVIIEAKTELLLYQMDQSTCIKLSQ